MAACGRAASRRGGSWGRRPGTSWADLLVRVNVAERVDLGLVVSEHDRGHLARLSFADQLGVVQLLSGAGLAGVRGLQRSREAVLHALQGVVHDGVAVSV